MEEWNIKRTPMLHFCLLTTSLKPVRETCDVSRCCTTSPLSGGKPLLKLFIWAPAVTNRERESRSVSGEMTSAVGRRWQRASERETERERDFQSVNANTVLCFCSDTHTCDEAARSAGFPLLVPLRGPLHEQLPRSSCVVPDGPQRTRAPPPRIKTIAAGSERKIHAASSHLESVRKNDPWAHIHPGRPWGEKRQVRRPSGGGSEAQEAARVRWRGSVLQQVRGPSLLLVWKNPGCSTSLINNSAVCWSAIYFQLCAAAVSCSVEMFIAEGRNQSRQSFLCSHKRPVTL